METKALNSNGSQQMIREAIRKIALGRSIERVDMSPGGTGGVGTARMIHGYVAKIHDDPGDEEFGEYGGTIATIRSRKLSRLESCPNIITSS